jgi:phospho-N-acetylmuramoyl-pentapeptide-transferase
MYINVLKVFTPAALAFFIGLTLTPFLTDFLYKHRCWKKKAGKVDPLGKETPIFNSLHKEKETGTPRMGGIIIWVSVLCTIGVIYVLTLLFPGDEFFLKLNFLSRGQTWLPLFTLIIGSLVGLVDDILQIKGNADCKAGLAFWKRSLMVIILGLIGGLWFYNRLGMTSVHIPFSGPLELGILIIPFFIFVMFSLFSSGVIDGLDGLSGGVMAIIFSAYAGIAYFQNRIDLAAFCVVVVGGILAFLWYNIPPARFYMSETGILGLTTTLTVIAFLTDSVIILPIIAFPLFITSASVVIQLTSKKFRNGKKIFLVAPVHHHFEAIGWPAYKVVMRYWVIGIIMAIIGMVIALIG